MIHEIRIENFFCIRDEVVLDLRIPKNAPDLPRFRPSHSKPDVRLPCVAMFMGPNAAGKSTILRALTSTVYFACRSFELGVADKIPGFQPFMSEECTNKPIKISIDFDAGWLTETLNGDAGLFRYQLEIVSTSAEPLTGYEVGYEALFHFPRRQRRRLFERKGPSEPIYVSKEFHMTPSDARIKSVRPNSSVISTLAKLNNELAKKIWTELNMLQSNLWGLQRTNPQTEVVLRHYQNHPELLDKLNNELRRFDVGISDMELQKSDAGLFAWFNHAGLIAPILMDEESSGTRHLVHMFPQLDFVLATGHVAIFDEFDADLHPDLVRELFTWFQSPERNRYSAQLFITAQNAALLDYVDKNEVFLVEKDLFGATRVYGARDVRGLRRETSLYNKYMGGALGALPKIG